MYRRTYTYDLQYKLSIDISMYYTMVIVDSKENKQKKSKSEKKLVKSIRELKVRIKAILEIKQVG